MAKRKIADKSAALTGSEEIPSEAQSVAKASAKIPADLPEVGSPSISPAVSEAVAIDEPAIEPKPEPEVEAAQSESEPKSEAVLEPKIFALVPVVQPAEHESEQTAEPAKAAPFFTLKARHKRYARLAASVAIGAVLGAIGGTLLTGGLGAPPTGNVAVVEENKAMQQSLTRLAKDVTVLKAKLATTAEPVASETAVKVATNTVAKSAERIAQEGAEITGSISPPQTVVVSVPTPRPAPRIAMAESQPTRPHVVQDWSVRDARGGYVYVETRGEIYQIVPGAPLPGLGPVQSVKRLEGRWVVTTPKGIIVSMRDRRHFE